MAGHSRPKDGVASLAYVPAIPILGARRCLPKRDRRYKPGDDKQSLPRSHSFTDSIFKQQFLFAHDLVRKPVPIPDQVRDRLFRDHAFALGLADTAACQRATLVSPSGIGIFAGFMKSTVTSAVMSATE